MTHLPFPLRRTTLSLLGIALFTPAAAGWAQSSAPVAPPAASTPARAAATARPDHASAYFHYGMAKIYEDQAVANGRQDLATQAIEQYKLALDADPDSAQLQNGLANLYFRLGRIREAVTAAQDQISRHPDDVEAHTLLGRVYLRSLDDHSGGGPQSQEMLNAAIKEYETITRLKPKDVEAHLFLGQLYGLDHDSVRAQQQFLAAQAIDPSSEEVVLSLARLYSEQGDLNKAAQAIAQVPADQRTARENFALGEIYDQLKQPKQAVTAYQAAVDQDPGNANAQRALAGALQAAGQMDAAAKIYGQLASSDPQDAQSLIHEADIERQQGHYEQALATLKKAEALASDNLELSYNEALDYDALGRYDDAIRTIKAALAFSASPTGKYQDADRTNRAAFLDRLGIVDREAGKDDDAVEAYKQMQALGGDMAARGYEGEIDAYRDAHNWAAALETAEAASKALPGNVDIQLAYARQLGDNGKLDQGVKLAMSQLNGKPENDREVYVTIADMQSRDKHWKQAFEALDKAEATASKPADKLFIDYFRGSIQERQKMFDEAQAEYQKALAIDPNYAPVQNDYGYMLIDRGQKLPEATSMIQKALVFDPQNGAYLDSLAWAYYKQGEYAMAEDTERKAVMRQPNDPSILSHMGVIYAHNGKLSQAVAAWERSVAQYATTLPADADPADVSRTQHDLENARVRLAHAGAGPAK